MTQRQGAGARAAKTGWLMAAAVLASAACGTTPYEVPEGESPAENPPAVATQPWTVCRPRAVVQQPSMRPDLPASGGDACVLVRTADDQNGDGTADSTVDYERDGDVLRVVTRARGRVTQSLEYGFDAAGRLTSAGSRDGSYRWSYAWTYDDAGRMLREAHQYHSVYGGDGDSVVEQRFEGERLVARTRTDRGRVTESLRWRYDGAGRLVEAEASNPSTGATLERATWTYDDAGRPTAWTRSSDRAGREQGREEVRYTFAYDARGVVRARTLTRQRPTSAYYGGYSHAFDQYSVAAQGGGVSAEEGCTPLPTQATYGYPAGEGAYALAFGDLADDDYELRSMYGAITRYYSYAPPTAFGHTGTLADHDEPLARSAHGVLSVVTEYDARGLMLRETVTAERVHVVRERVFEGGLLTLDRLSGTGLQDDRGAELRERTLRFERDGAGRLTARTLSAPEGTLVRHGWQYDAAGRPTAHTVETTDEGRAAGYRDRGELRRAYDAAGRVSLDALTRPAEEGRAATSYERTRARDGEGRVTLERKQSHGTVSETQTDYDARGLVTRSLSRSRAATAPAWTSEVEETIARNAAGQPTHHAWRTTHARGTTRRAQSFTYACGR